LCKHSLSDCGSSIVKGVNINNFRRYYQLPGILSDRVFNCLSNKKKFIHKSDFVKGMVNLFTGDFNFLTKFVFDLYDFDGDGWISKEDIQVLLSYIPIDEKKSHSTDPTNKLYQTIRSEEFKSQVKSQYEIQTIIHKIFRKDNLMDYKNFIYSIESVSAGIFLNVKLFK
jgi:hypothetical protein